jgi:hypothetical protein
MHRLFLSAALILGAAAAAHGSDRARFVFAGKSVKQLADAGVRPVTKGTPMGMQS